MDPEGLVPCRREHSLLCRRDVGLQDMTIRQGSDTFGFGGGIYNDGTVTISNSTLSDNLAAPVPLNGCSYPHFRICSQRSPARHSN